MHNIGARFVQDSLLMHKICARLYLFPQCAIYAQGLHKIVLISPMRNIRTRLQVLLEEICVTYHISDLN